MRYLGLDLGSRTLGCALSDKSGIFARSYTIIRHNEEYDRLIKDVYGIVTLEKVEAIVLGYPKNMNNTLGERVEKTLAFKEMLERRTNLPVVMWDERLTTNAAEQILIESGVRRENRKSVIDKIAAVLILQGYLDLQAQGKAEE